MHTFRSVIVISVLVTSGYLSGSPQEPIPADTTVLRSTVKRAAEFRTRGEYDSAIILFDRAADSFRRIGKEGDRINALVSKADCLLEKGKFDLAYSAVRIDSASEHRLIGEYPSIAARRLIMLGSIHRQQGKYDSVFHSARRAQTILLSVSPASTDLEWDIHTLFGAAYFAVGEHDSALAVYRRALTLFHVPTVDQQLKLSATNNSIAGVFESRGEYQKALLYFTRSLDFRRTVLGEKHPDIANLYNNIAAIHFRTGDNDLALEYYLKSLSIMNETLEAGHPSFGVRYNNIAMAYRGKKEYEKALEYGRMSRDIFIKKLGDRHPNVAGVVNNIGRTYSDMGQYHRALESYQTALAVWNEKLGEKHPNVLQSYFNIGEAFGALNDLPSSRSWLMQSFQSRREVLGEKNVKTAQSCNALGKLYADWGKTDTSLLWYRRAAAALADSSNDGGEFAVSAAMSGASDPDLLISLTGMAQGLFLRGTGQKERTDLEASLRMYDAAVQLTEKIRRGFGTEGSKLQLSQTAFNVYEQALSAALRLYERTKDEQFLSAAFSYSERSKAGMLLDAITEMNAQRFSGIPDSLLEYETSLRIGITFNETQLQKEKEKKEKRNAHAVTRYENALFDLKRKYEQLTAEFERSYPAYFSLRHQSTGLPLTRIRESLPDKKSALIEYFTGDSAVTIFVVTKERSFYKTVRIPLLSDRVKQFRSAVQNIGSDRYIEHAAALYAQLISPVRASLKGIRKLIIVPDGILQYLPFEALLTIPNKQPGPVDFSSLSYLIKEYEISYLASARLLEDAPSNPSGNEIRSFLGIAPVFSDLPPHSKKIFSNASERVQRSRMIEGEQFAELKESEHEVRSIADLFTSRNIPAAISLHRDAEESLLSSDTIGRYGFIHIASHGVINEGMPKLSGIIFAEPSARSAGDGVLYAGEIYNLRLNADLVVLSACETGLGSIVKGEGLIGLTRGFLYAGVRNLLVSLWQVGDRSTAELMVKCYRNILNGRSFSAALRNAKLDMIEQGTYAHPVEWSPFILNGR